MGRAEGLEDGALLDVELEVGGCVAGSSCLASRMRCMSMPRALAASARVMPCLSVSLPISSGSIAPEQAEDPKSERPKAARLPPSHQSTSLMVIGGVPSALMRRRTSRPASTYQPPVRSQPPFGTESKCPPMISVLG